MSSFYQMSYIKEVQNNQKDGSSIDLEWLP